MAIPTSLIPPTPLNIGMQSVIGNSAPQTATITLSAPTSDTLITGLTQQITVPSIGQFIKVTVLLPSVTISAATTITISVYSGATTGTLTTLVQSQAFISGTAATQFCGDYIFFIPVTATGTAFPQAGSTTFLSITAKASTGNFVVNATATLPASSVVEVL